MMHFLGILAVGALFAVFGLLRPADGCKPSDCGGCEGSCELGDDDDV